MEKKILTALKPAAFLFSFFLIPSLVFVSCTTQASAEKKLTPPKSIRDFRLDDISKQIEEDPARAIHLLETYEIIYGELSVYPDGTNPDVKNRLDALRSQAQEALKAAQIKAIEEKNWTKAASLARSLSSMGISSESTGEEPDLVLQYAREQLAEGKDLTAFIAAVRANGLRPLAYEDALLFLKRAAELKQRRTAAWFFSAIDEMGRAGDVSDDLKAFARGRDSAADMIKGVATVWIDRGIRIQQGRGIPDRVLGSAFFVDGSGYLITNYHVISSEVDPSYKGYSRMYIRMGDSSSARIPARVIGWDKAMDLALIKTEITPEYVYSVVDWIIPKVGETIYAIGSPVGLEKTVTQGIVSALGRRFLQIGDVIQIDAAVNFGNSGGPVIDMEGRLVGVVFAGIEQFQGLNFAVPAEKLAAALPSMIAGGKAERPWLGLSLCETQEGAEIIYVSPSTPGAEQRIKEGSIIKAINGEKVEAAQGALIPALQDRLYPLMPGELVTIDLAGPDGSLTRHLLTLAARPDLPMLEAANMDSRERVIAPLYGLLLEPNSGSGPFPGFRVRRVVRGSTADEAGLSENDPVTIRSFKVFEKEGYVLLDVDVKKRRMGYLEASMRLPALLETPNTL